MKIIITGSSGMVGSAVAQYLNNLGVNVIKAGRSKENDLQFNPLSVEKDGDEIWPLCDAIIHIAAANEIDCRTNPKDSIQLNVAGTQEVLEKCVRSKIPSFIYVSTFHVYGKATGHIDEDTMPDPFDTYGLTHLFAEQYIRAYAKTYNIQATILRPSNLFGVPQQIQNFNRWSLIPFGFCKEAIFSKKIILKTPGLQQRNFVHLEILSEQILESVNNNKSIKILNIAGIDTYSVKTFAELISERAKEILGLTIEITYPNGENKEEQINYTSRHLKANDNKKYRISKFIDEMLIKINTQYKSI